MSWLPTPLTITIFVGTRWAISSIYGIGSSISTNTFTSSIYSSNLLRASRSCSTGTSPITTHWSSKVSIGSMNPMGPSRVTHAALPGSSVVLLASELSPLVPFQSFPVIENLLYDRPCLHFGLRSHSCMRWASRWQSIEDVPVLGQGRQDVTAKSRLGLPAVKKHMRDVWVIKEKSREVVGHFFRDRRVQTSGPYAGLKGIPERDTSRL